MPEGHVTFSRAPPFGKEVGDGLIEVEQTAIPGPGACGGEYCVDDSDWIQSGCGEPILPTRGMRDPRRGVE